MDLKLGERQHNIVNMTHNI